VAGLQRRQDLGMGQVDPGGVAGCRVAVEDEALAVLQQRRVVGEAADPQLRALE
jgi:hypothetical protein